jgi:general stress protein 26
VPSLPQAVAELVDRALVGELTVVAPDGRPVTYPMTPVLDGYRILMTSSVLDSRKLGHIKANPRVCLSVTDPTAVGGAPAKVAIQGDARVIEDDLHSDWERLLPSIGRKDPSIPALLKARVGFPLLFERAIIELSPKKTLYWPDGRTDRAPAVSALEPAR